MSNLQTTQRTVDAITVVWDPAGSYNCGPVLYYIVTIRNLAIPCDTNSFNINLTLRSAEFHDLMNNVTYAISVGAVNRAGVGMETTINVTTLAVTTSETSQGAYTTLYHSAWADQRLAPVLQIHCEPGQVTNGCNTVMQ